MPRITRSNADKKERGERPVSDGQALSVLWAARLSGGLFNQKWLRVKPSPIPILIIWVWFISMLSLKGIQVRHNAKNFFLGTVRPTVAEFERESFDLRRARLAAIVLYHMADHFALDGIALRDRSYMDKQIADIRARILEQCPEFALIGDVADASKHAKLATRPNHPRQLSSVEQISASPGMFQAPFGEGLFAEAVEVVVTLDDGRPRPLLPSVRAVLAAWSAVFESEC